MDLRLSIEQEELVGAFAAMYGRHATPERVRAAEPRGFDESLWGRLVEMGVPAMGVDEAQGGWGATMLDLALIAEQHGRHVAPAPLVEALVAARLLARCGAPAEGLLDAALSGRTLVTVAVRPAGDGRATLVPAGGVADTALVVDGDRLLAVPLAGARTEVENLGALPLADVAVGGSAEVIAVGSAARDASEHAIDEWLALTSAALVGLGARALEIGVDYAKERRAWGVPIGTFQAVSHPLADGATALDGARLLSYEAAWAAAEDPGRASELAAMAGAFAYETARDVTYHSLHVHGGYGFMMEYDVQLYWRRARAWANVFGDAGTMYGRAADARYGAVAG